MSSPLSQMAREYVISKTKGHMYSVALSQAKRVIMQTKKGHIPTKVAKSRGHMPLDSLVPTSMKNGSSNWLKTAK